MPLGINSMKCKYTIVIQITPAHCYTHMHIMIIAAYNMIHIWYISYISQHAPPPVSIQTHNSCCVTYTLQQCASPWFRTMTHQAYRVLSRLNPVQAVEGITDIWFWRKTLPQMYIVICMHTRHPHISLSYIQAMMCSSAHTVEFTTTPTTYSSFICFQSFHTLTYTRNPTHTCTSCS